MSLTAIIFICIGALTYFAFKRAFTQPKNNYQVNSGAHQEFNQSNLPVYQELEFKILSCLACEKEIKLLEMLKNSYCFGGDAIVFECPSCKEKNYYYPRGDEIEIGMLGCSPAIDPIPFYKYKATVQLSRLDQEIIINFADTVITIPSSIRKSQGQNTVSIEKQSKP